MRKLQNVLDIISNIVVTVGIFLSLTTCPMVVVWVWVQIIRKMKMLDINNISTIVVPSIPQYTSSDHKATRYNIGGILPSTQKGSIV